MNQESEQISDPTAEATATGLKAKAIALITRMRIRIPEFKPNLASLARFKPIKFNFRLNSGCDSLSKARFLGVALVIASLLYLIGVPLTQPYLVKLWQLAPVWLVPLLTVPLLLTLAKKETESWVKKIALLSGTAIAGATLCAFMLLANTAPWFVESQMAASLKPINLTEIPQTENLRILGQGTASWYLHSKNPDNRLETVGLPQLVRERQSDGSYSMWWQGAYSFKTGRLSSWIPRLLGSTQSILRINASELEMSNEGNSGANTKFVFGEESLFTETLFRWHHPLSQRAEATYYRSNDDKWSLLIPYISYSPTITGTMLPVLGGVMQVNQWGWVTDYTVEDAARLFPGSVLYPSVLARQYGEAYGHYRTGLLNVWINESGIYQISEDTPKPGENQQPYIQSFDMGTKGHALQEVLALEPAGKQSFALAELLFFDAQTGKTHVYKVPATSSLNGPRRALKQATNADPETDWNAYSIQEPRLVVRTNSNTVKKSWLMTEVKNEGDDHTAVRLIITDMETLKPLSFSSRSELEKFISGGNVTP
jgi:hypothetical protein